MYNIYIYCIYLLYIYILYIYILYIYIHTIYIYIVYICDTVLGCIGYHKMMWHSELISLGQCLSQHVSLPQESLQLG